MQAEEIVKFPFEFPKLSPVPIKTKGLHWYQKVKVWFTKPRRWIFVADWTYKTSDGTIIYIPEGFVFDGASIPRPFWWFLSPTGLLLIPAVIHDFIYKNGFYFDITDFNNRESDWKGRVVTVNCKRSVADKMFYDIAYEVNEIHLADIPAYAAVRMFGWAAWNKHVKNRKEEIEKIKQEKSL